MTQSIQPQSDFSISKQLQQVLNQWYAAGRQYRQNFNWNNTYNSNILIDLLSYLFPDICFEDLITPYSQLQQICLKLITSVLKLKTLKSNESVIYDISNSYVFVMEGQGVSEMIDDNRRTSSLKKNIETDIKFLITNCYECIKSVCQMEKIEYLGSQNYKNIRISSCYGQLKLLVGQKNLMQRFKHEMIKSDTTRKVDFFYKYLFCGFKPPLNSKLIYKIKYCRNNQINTTDDRILLLYQGQIQYSQHIYYNNDNNNNDNNNNNNSKFIRKSTLCKGAIIPIQNIQKNYEQQINKQTSLRQYFAINQCIVLSLHLNQFTKIVSNQPKIGKALSLRIDSLKLKRTQLTQRRINAQKSLKQNNNHSQVIFSIPGRNKNSKAFRRRKTLQACEYQQFMTFNKYEKITQNKQRVQSRHKLFYKFGEYVKQKKQEQRFNKKINTQEGFKEAKRKQLSVRLKKTKIQNLANKASLKNTKKYENNVKQIQFYFQGNNSNKTPNASTYKRWISMQQVDQKISKTPQQNKQNIVNLSNINSVIFRKDQPIIRKSQKNHTCLKFRVLSASKRCSISEF